MEVSKNVGGYLVFWGGVRIIRIIVSWDLYWGRLLYGGNNQVTRNPKAYPNRLEVLHSATKFPEVISGLYPRQAQKPRGSGLRGSECRANAFHTEDKGGALLRPHCNAHCLQTLLSECLKPRTSYSLAEVLGVFTYKQKKTWEPRQKESSILGRSQHDLWVCITVYMYTRAYYIHMLIFKCIGTMILRCTKARHAEDANPNKVHSKGFGTSVEVIISAKY